MEEILWAVTPFMFSLPKLSESIRIMDWMVFIMVPKIPNNYFDQSCTVHKHLLRMAASGTSFV
jgi:hypothetical protein